MSNTQLTYLRLGATIAVSGLTAAFAYYPHQVWIPCVIAAMATVGIHAIPSVGQTSPSINPSIKAATVKTEHPPTVPVPSLVEPIEMEPPLKKLSGQTFTGE